MAGETDARTLGRLDDPPDRHQLEAERRQFLSGYDGALLWEVGVDSDFGMSYGLRCHVPGQGPNDTLQIAQWAL